MYFDHLLIIMHILSDPLQCHANLFPIITKINTGLLELQSNHTQWCSMNSLHTTQTIQFNVYCSRLAFIIILYVLASYVTIHQLHTCITLMYNICSIQVTTLVCLYMEYRGRQGVQGETRCTGGGKVYREREGRRLYVASAQHRNIPSHIK